MSNLWAVVVVAGFVALMWKLQSQKEDIESLKADLGTLKDQPKLTLHITQWLLRHAREGRSPPASLSHLAGCGATIGGTDLLTDGDGPPEPTCPNVLRRAVQRLRLDDRAGWLLGRRIASA